MTVSGLNTSRTFRGEQLLSKQVDESADVAWHSHWEFTPTTKTAFNIHTLWVG